MGQETCESKHFLSPQKEVPFLVPLVCESKRKRKRFLKIIRQKLIHL